MTFVIPNSRSKKIQNLLKENDPNFDLHSNKSQEEAQTEGTSHSAVL